MFKSISTAFHIKELRKKLLFTIGMIMLVRIGSQIPVPGIDASYFKEWFQRNSNGAFNILSAFTGGSFEKFSVFGLGITPYITASIIIQLLSIVIPALEELRRDGDYGQKKMEWINRGTAIGLAFAESVAMSIGFGRSGLIPNMSILRGISIVFFLTGGSALLILAGELIKKHGVGNGISIILAVNILSRIPNDLYTLAESFVFHKTLAKGALAALIIAMILVATIVFVIILNDAHRDLLIQYSKKTAGRRLIGGQASKIPIKVNVANVMPVIFASSLLSIPQLAATLCGKGYGSGISKFILNAVNQNNWFSPQHPEYSVGLVFYVAMVFYFAYFYASISFNPMEIADNLRKQGGVVPGLRPGKPTELYIKKTVNTLTVIGAAGLMLVVLIPVIFNGLFGASVSFGGTSIIIIVGVTLETLQQIEAQMQGRKHEGFLLGDK